MSARTSRREFLRLAALASVGSLLVACQQAAPPSVPNKPSAAVAAADWEKDWEATVAAAKKEGKLNLATSLGVGYRSWVAEFEKTFPGIHVELLQTQNANDFVNTYVEERKANLYQWDLWEATASIALVDLRPHGALAPIRPLLVNRPDIVDDTFWRKGFEAGWQDNEKQLAIAHSESVSGMIGINTDLVKEGEVRGVPDLLNPKWKGQIMVANYTSGSVFAPMHAVRLKYGEDAVRRFLIDQEPVIIRSQEQNAEFLVRGRYPMSGYVTGVVLKRFVDEGLGQNVKLVDIPDYSFIIQYCLWFLDQAPHPNAAKLFFNWNLMQAGAQAYTNNVLHGSRRVDVEPGDPLTRPREGQDYMTTGLEAGLAEVNKTRALVEGLSKLRT